MTQLVITNEVTGSNPVEVLTFSGFYTQLLKLRSYIIAMIMAYLKECCCALKHQKYACALREKGVVIRIYAFFLACVTIRTNFLKCFAVRVVWNALQPQISSGGSRGFFFCDVETKLILRFAMPFKSVLLFFFFFRYSKLYHHANYRNLYGIKN